MVAWIFFSLSYKDDNVPDFEEVLMWQNQMMLRTTNYHKDKNGWKKKRGGGGINYSVITAFWGRYAVKV